MFLMICNVAKALSLMPLREVVEKNANSNTDPAFQVYVFNRCAGAHKYLATILLKANKKDKVMQFTTLSSKFSTMAGVRLVNKLNYSQDDALKKVKESLKESLDNALVTAKTAKRINKTSIDIDNKVTEDKKPNNIKS